MSLVLTDEDLLRGQAFIDGQWLDADSGETVATTNPATGLVVAQVAKCGAAETRRAVAAAV
jgi:succinate-semialdehyde dehydrogenase/glutarate-semialdehyde dehydrogenase